MDKDSHENKNFNQTMGFISLCMQEDYHQNTKLHVSIH